MSSILSLKTVDRFLELNNSTVGRDKVAKLLQYGAKVFGYFLDQHLASLQNELDRKEFQKYCIRTANFESGVAMGRKVTRFWRPIQGVMLLIRFIEKVSRGEKITIFDVLELIQKLLNANYFFFDNLIWAARLNILPSNPNYSQAGVLANPFIVENNARFARISNLSWFYANIIAIILGTKFVMDSYTKEAKLLKQKREELRKEQQDGIAKIDEELKKLKTARFNKMINLLSLWSDLGVSAGFAGLWNPNKLVVGILGSTAAIIGIWENWK